MTNLRTAAEMALDTLDAISESGIYYKENPFDAYMRLRSMARGAIEALRTALAQPEQSQTSGYANKIESLIKERDDLRQALAQPEKEPMSFQTWRSRQHGDPEEIGFLQALKHAYESGQYSVSPPRKEWVGLTDEQIAEIAAVSALKTPDDIYFARLIEAMLKEKNA